MPLRAITVAGVVPKLSRTPGELHRSGGTVGRDTESVLRELAGIGEQELEHLVQAGVVKCRDTAASGEEQTTIDSEEFNLKFFIASSSDGDGSNRHEKAVARCAA